jgi:mannitol/fructose-specific phosphotransferase system IIA component (Ntr-type)
VDIFDSLLNRERLGSTGLGTGVAIPHGRMTGIDAPVGAIITLKNGVDYDAVDHQPVDLLFALVVPEASTDEHLQILATLARMFSDRKLCENLRASQDAEQLLRACWTAGNCTAPPHERDAHGPKSVRGPARQTWPAVGHREAITGRTRSGVTRSRTLTYPWPAISISSTPTASR